MRFTKQRVVRLLLLAAVTLTASDVNAEDPQVTELRGRTDTSEMVAKLSMARASRGGLPAGRSRIDFEALLTAIHQSSGAAGQANWTRLSDVDGNEVAEANGRTLSVNRRTGLIRMRDLRGYESSSPTRASDNQLLARSRPILAALGATADQTQFAVRSLMVGSRDGDGTPVTDREMARKVMVTRAIAGIPVEADHIVLSYSLDGSLRKILGRWHQIDFDRSRFSTVLSDAETFEHAMQKLETESIQTNLSIARDGVARVRTVLVLAENTDEYVTFEPAGRVEVPTVGPGGTLTTVFDFDM